METSIEIYFRKCQILEKKSLVSTESAFACAVRTANGKFHAAFDFTMNFIWSRNYSILRIQSLWNAANECQLLGRLAKTNTKECVERTRDDDVNTQQCGAYLLVMTSFSFVLLFSFKFNFNYTMRMT